MLNKLLIFGILALARNGNVTCVINPGKEISTIMAQCLADISSRYFPENRPIAVYLPIIRKCDESDVFFSQNDDALLINFNNESKYQQIIVGCYGGELATQDYLNKPDAAIILLPDLELYYLRAFVFVSLTKISILLGSLGFPAVIVSSHVYTSKKEQKSAVLGMLNRAWLNVSATDIIVLVPEVRKSPGTPNKDLSIEIYSWLPERQRDACLHELTEVTLLDTWVPPERRFVKNSNLFPRKNTMTRNCILSVGLYTSFPFVYFDEIPEPGSAIKEETFYGLYKYILKVLKEQYHFGFSFYNAHGTKFRYDISLPVYLGRHTYKCAVTYPRFTSTLTWYVPLFPIPRWQGLIRVFGSTQWLLVAVAYMLGTLTFLIIKMMENKKNLDIIIILINTLQTHLAIGIPYKYKGIVSAAFMTLWLFYCIQVCTFFQTELIGFLTNPGYFPQINDLTSLNNSGFERMSNVVFDNEDAVIYPICPFETCLRQLASRHKVAVLGSTFEFDINIKYKYNINGKPDFDKVVESLRTFYFTSTTTKGCMFSDFLNVVIRRFVEAGLTNKWMEDLKRRDWVSSFNRQHRDTSEPYVRPLNLSSVQLHFYVLMTGLSLSFLVFVIEILYSVSNFFKSIFHCKV